MADDRPAAEAPSVVDAHFHLIDLQRLHYPWIDRPVPQLQALLPTYYDVAREYDVAAYHRDVPAERVVASVGCEFGAADGLAEARLVQRLSERHGTPAGFVAALDPASSSVAERLAQYADLPVVRGVRQPLYWAADPLRRLGAHPDSLTDPVWRRGFEQVAESGLVWDLLVYDEQVPAAVDLVRAFPSTPIVLEAAGWPLDRTPDGFARWRDRMEEVSSCPNVTLKLQGLALPPRNADRSSASRARSSVIPSSVDMRSSKVHSRRSTGKCVAAMQRAAPNVSSAPRTHGSTAARSGCTGSGPERLAGSEAGPAPGALAYHQGAVRHRTAVRRPS